MLAGVHSGGFELFADASLGVDDDFIAVVSADAVLDRRGGVNQVQVELALQPLLDDFHVQEAKEPASKAMAQRDR